MFSFPFLLRMNHSEGFQSGFIVIVSTVFKILDLIPDMLVVTRNDLLEVREIVVLFLEQLFGKRTAGSCNVLLENML